MCKYIYINVKIHVYSIHIYKYIYIHKRPMNKNRCAQGDIMIFHSRIEFLDQFPCVLSGMAKQVGTPTKASEAN